VASDDNPPVTPVEAQQVFGDRLATAEEFVELLRQHGVERGLIGPREIDRLWERHVLNSAVLAERVVAGARVIDVGSGAGLPGVPLAIARPDLDVVLLEPMARRVAWLTEVVEKLSLGVEVVRGRAEEWTIRSEYAGADVVTARAVAPMARLAGWCLPLLRPGGSMLALKGASAAEEVARDRAEIARAGGGRIQVHECGVGVLEVPTTLVEVVRTSAAPGDGERSRTRRQRPARGARKR
jgi:16S rRNA (guanine527-N7)-methyltransferase